jgi:regulator of sirC expression with transglutaminase-like and TPR domain/ribosomal protein L40E
MPEANEIICEVCGTSNPPTATDCKECGMKLKGIRKGAEVERLLEELIQAPSTDKAKAEDSGLDLDKETVDELLDSLLVETTAAEAEEVATSAEAVEGPLAPPEERFECPKCGAEVAADAGKCPNCGAVFAAEEEGAEAPAPEAEAPPSVSISETDVSKVSALSGRLIDVVVLGTIAALLVIFAVFQMWSWDSIAGNPLSLYVFVVVALVGFGAGLVLFRASSSAIVQADRLVKEGRNEEAIALYDRAIRMGSKPATAWTSKGVAFKRLGRLDEAMRCHNVALKLNPNNEIAWCNKGDILFRAGRLEKAIECFDRAIELRPKYAIAWNNKGAALARMGRFEDAKACHDRAVELKPRYVAAWLNRGEVLARLGDRAEAQRCLDRAKALGA